MINRALSVLVAGLAITVAFAANAQPVQKKDKYNFIEGRFVVDAEIDDLNDDADGFRFGGSYRFNNQIYGVAEFETVEFDDSDADLDILRFGGGYIHPLQKGWDLNVEVQLIRAEIDAGWYDDDETGYSVAGGVRGMVTPEIQLRGQLVLEDIFDSDTYITLGADYFFQSNLSGGIEMDVAGDYETFSMGVRFYF